MLRHRGVGGGTIGGVFDWQRHRLIPANDGAAQLVVGRGFVSVSGADAAKRQSIPELPPEARLCSLGQRSEGKTALQPRAAK